jgi:hypothetical protein
MKKIILFCIGTLLLVSLTACGKNPEVLAARLDSVLQDDLKYMVAEVKSKTGQKYLIDKPYYVVEKYKRYQGDTARVIAAYAVVKFYYFKEDMKLCQKRHYRYWSSKDYWDRERKELVHI